MLGIDIDIKDIIDIAQLAGDEISKIYNHNNYYIRFKKDNSPVTMADINANDIICNFLAINYKDIPILSEENNITEYVKRANWDRFWLIDPLDGTREFIAKNGEFTVNIALIQNNMPILGVIYAPIKKMMFYGKHGYGAFCNNKKITPLINKKQIVFATSRNYTNNQTLQYIKSYKTDKIKKQNRVGSSFKFCLLATGKVDIYPRFSSTMEWDTAAAHAILLECGKNIYKTDEITPISYNKEDLKNPHFIAK